MANQLYAVGFYVLCSILIAAAGSTIICAIGWGICSSSQYCGDNLYVQWMWAFIISIVIVSIILLFIITTCCCTVPDSPIPECSIPVSGILQQQNTQSQIPHSSTSFALENAQPPIAPKGLLHPLAADSIASSHSATSDSKVLDLI